MGSFFFPCFCFASFVLLLSPPLSSASILSFVSVKPNFSASHFLYVDHAGAFLLSANQTFKAAISKPTPQVAEFYFSIIHVNSNTIIWTANTATPMSRSTKIYLTDLGLHIADDRDTNSIWSTPTLSSSVSSMKLLESGNLVLYDEGNFSLWESFDYPTDTIVTGQRLAVGKFLSSFQSSENLSIGDSKFLVTATDGLLQWNGMNFWKLSMDPRVIVDSNFSGAFLAMNQTGLYLYGDNNTSSSILIGLSASSDFRIAKLKSKGKFSVMRYQKGDKMVQEFATPTNKCRLPFYCGKLGLCDSERCSCPSGFHSERDCVPTSRFLSLPVACTNGYSNSSLPPISYLELGNGNESTDYFALDFMNPVKIGISLSECKEYCSKDCSCLGIFIRNSSGSCYLMKNHIGSLISSVSKNDQVGFVKAFVTHSSSSSDEQKNTFSLACLILVLSAGSLSIAILVVVIIWCRKKKKKEHTKLSRFSSRNSSSSDNELMSIPGLPIRFDYEELDSATDSFKTKVGSGGFGTVYKGTLKDNSVVAVKRMNNLGVQGKKEFLTEIAIIGNIHHVNLVKLKGFCAYGRQRFLVYEFMDRGSLDHTLFSNGPVLGWQDRFEIALATARGLAYLHSGCDHKIIHCDVKPENILLNERLQAKLSDFGLSKLLGQDESGLLTTMRGTRGYLAPEWLTSTGISDRTDVYSYGMVLLEIVRGKRNCSLQASGESTQSGSSSSGSDTDKVYFPLFALEMHEKRDYLGLIDPRLKGEVAGEEIIRLVQIALCCVHEEPMLRPSMANVVGMLERKVTLAAPRAESLKYLKFHGRRFAETPVVGGSDGRI